MRLIGKRSTAWVSILLFIFSLVMPYINVTAIAEANAPVINIYAPTEGQKVFNNYVDLNFSVTDGVVTEVYKNGTVYPGLTAPGRVNGLSLGQNTLLVRAVNNYGISEVVVNVFYDDEPQLTNLLPSNGSVFDSDFSVSGNYENTTSLKILVNNREVWASSIAPPFAPGIITAPNISVSDLVVGNNVITFEASNGTKTITKDIRITYAPAAPEVFELTPVNNTKVFTSSVTITGKVTTNTTTLTLENLTSGGMPESIPITSAKTFTKTVTLQQGMANNLRLTPGPGGAATTLTIIHEKRPQITINEPAGAVTTTVGTHTASLYTNDRTFTVKGRIDNATYSAIRYNNVETPISASGDFSRTVTLLAGSNDLRIIARNSEVGDTTAVLTVFYNGAPGITITNPADTSVQTKVYRNSFTVSGQVTNTISNGLTIQRQGSNAETVSFDSNGNFSKQITLNPGVQTITIRATDGSSTTTKNFNLYYDDTPYLSVDTPVSGATISNNRVIVSGNVQNADNNGLFINGEQVYFNSTTGYFSREITLNAGTTNIEVKAKKGNRYTIKNIPIVFNGGPEIIIDSYEDKDIVYSNVVTISGYLRGVVTQNTPYSQVDLKINNISTNVDVNGRFSREVTLKQGNNTITANLKAGNYSSTKVIKLNYVDMVVEGAVFETTVSQNGGTIKAFDNQVSLNIPKGVLPADSKITFEVMDPSDLDKDRDTVYVSHIFDIDGAKSELIKPVTLTMQYIEGIKDAQAQKVALYYYDDGDWESVPAKVDTKKHTVTGQVDKLGRYAVMSYIKTFNDVIGHWAQGDIELLLAKGIANGKSSSMYYPDSYVTRAEFTKLIMEALGVSKYDADYANFKDVDDDHWAYEYIQGAVRVGIVKGTSTYRFSPEQPITRAEAAAMISRAAGFKAMKKEEAKNLISKFKDKNYIGEWAETPIAEAMQAGIINGYTADTFRPNYNTTRAQAAKMIVRLMIQQKKL